MNQPPASVELLALRQAIDGVDDALAGLLACRVSLSRQAQSLKARDGLLIIDSAREAAIQSRYEERLCGASKVARSVLELCREN